MAEVLGNEHLMGEVMRIIGMEIRVIQAGRSTIVPTIVGDPGIGKSASLKALGASMNLDVHIISLGALPMEWFSGLPEFADMEIDPSTHAEGKTNIKVTEWTMSDLIRTINNKTDQAIAAGKGGLLVLLDDLHLVEPIVQKYLFEFFQNKTLQSFKLRPEAYLVGAMNGKDSAGMEGFHSAVINRMAMYFAKFDKEYWYDNIGFGLHPYVASFAQGPNDKYFTGANSVDGPSPSPRAWTELSEVIPALEAETSNTNELNHFLGMASASRVGDNATLEFIKHVKIFQKFDFKAILDAKDPEFKISGDVSEQILTAFIIRYLRSKEDAEYIKTVLEKNLQRRTFISIFISEFATMFKNIKEIQDKKTKEAMQHLSKLLTSEEAVDSELMDIVVDSLLDVR